MSSGEMTEERVIAYIDGFNLYFGLCEKGWRRYLWLDIPAFVERLLKPRQRLLQVKYFTTRVGGPEDSVRRQGIYLDALAAYRGLQPLFGSFNYADADCKGCGRTWIDREEKQTDVKIAVHMLRDAYAGAFDAALLISGDSDQVPVVEEIEGEHDGRVIAAFPPRRVSGDLARVASASFVIGRSAFHESQLPSMVSGKDGYMLCQPVEWWRDPSAAPTTR